MKKLTVNSDEKKFLNNSRSLFLPKPKEYDRIEFKAQKLNPLNAAWKSLAHAELEIYFDAKTTLANTQVLWNQSKLENFIHGKGFKSSLTLQ